ncbi:ComEC/Rec2 family competence protein [Flavobacterium sp. XGLA_31]|uniref:ComEC/Rec2 family competence protein n=1 Tax=Flavobacterium sp. XGLA_31 TaxID=3447666 RepID=UPI003F2A17A0
MKILQFPLSKIFIGFLFGLSLFQIVQLSWVWIILWIIICFSGMAIAHFFYRNKQFWKISFGCFVYAISLLTGLLTATFHTDTLIPNHYINQITEDEERHKILLLINEKLKSSSRNQRYVCKVVQFDSLKSLGKLILAVPKTGNQNYKIGTLLTANGIVYKNKKPFNPNLFDYGKYLENQGIYAQVYAKSNQIKVSRYEPGLWANFSNFREKIIENLKRSAISKDELYVLNALILGQQQEISSDILKDYQYAGAVHVLSVSGLHVGFILLFITFLLKPIGNTRRGSFLKLILIISSLWSFALLAGLSPSIVRSVTMFSFVAVGVQLRRTVNMYHTLMVSMLLILLFKPSFLFDVGFQLSYLAVFFILWLQPILTKLWRPENKITQYFWDIITVSFAAQIGTMPLSIYYFHQFPGLFFLTNLLILPLLGIIMAVGVLAISVAVFSTVPIYIIEPLAIMISLLNGIIHWIASLDEFVIRNISFSKEMLWGSYLAIILLIIWLKKPDFSRLSLAFTSVILLQIIFIFQKKETLSETELIIFNCKKQTLLSERIGQNVTVYCNNSTEKNLDNNIPLRSYLVGNFCKIKARKSLPDLMSFKHKKILIIDSSCVYIKSVNPDILIITQSPKLNLSRLLKIIKPKVIVADGSNFKSYSRMWETTCRKEKIPFHNTNEKGFYKL